MRWLGTGQHSLIGCAKWRLLADLNPALQNAPISAHRAAMTTSVALAGADAVVAFLGIRNPHTTASRPTNVNAGWSQSPL